MSEPPEPEQQRIDELLAAQTRGTATPAETEELALYVQARPELQREVVRAVDKGELGRGWLERVERDDQLQRVEHSAQVRMERGLGVGLFGLGTALSFVAPSIGVPMLGMGALLAMYSVVRVRLRTHRNDPYKDITR